MKKCLYKDLQDNHFGFYKVKEIRLGGGAYFKLLTQKFTDYMPNYQFLKPLKINFAHIPKNPPSIVNVKIK